MDPHAFEGRKRAYSGDSSDDNGQSTTLTGNYWTEADSHNDSISIGTRHQQQKKRQFRQLSPAPPYVSVWDRRIQNSPESYRDLVASFPGRLNRASASSPEPSPLGSSFQSLHEAPLLSHHFQNPSIPFGNVMRDEWRHQPRAVATHPTDSGSDDFTNTSY